MEVNSQYFSKEQVEAGEMTEFINVLLKQCHGKGNRYNDIHIKPEDCEAFSVEWINVPWDNAYGGSFQYVDEDQAVMTEFYLPDSSSGWFWSEAEFNEFLKDWLEKNPGWVKTSYGTWTNEIENEKFMKEYMQ